MTFASGIQGCTRFALQLVPSFVVVGLGLFGGPCVAQEVEPPMAPSAGGDSGSVTALSPWLGLIVPVEDRISLSLYGFYIGELDIPAVQADLSLRVAEFLTITPSYLYYKIPASGLDELATGPPGGFTDSYEEHQFRIDGTFTFSLSDFEISVRNMYVRRFRPTDDTDRYRGRIQISHPLTVGDHIWKPFVSYEAYYDEAPDGEWSWSNQRVSAGVTLPLTEHLSFRPSYMWDRIEGSKDINYLLFGLIYRIP